MCHYIQVKPMPCLTTVDIADEKVLARGLMALRTTAEQGAKITNAL